jgi:hypothetical protein
LFTLWRWETETCYKQCTFTVERDGKTEVVTKQVPYTIWRKVPTTYEAGEIAVFNCRGVRADPAAVPALLEKSGSVLLVALPKVDNETLRSLQFDAASLKTCFDAVSRRTDPEDHLILVVPASRLRER